MEPLHHQRHQNHIHMGRSCDELLFLAQRGRQVLEARYRHRLR